MLTTKRIVRAIAWASQKPGRVVSLWYGTNEVYWRTQREYPWTTYRREKGMSLTLQMDFLKYREVVLGIQAFGIELTAVTLYGAKVIPTRYRVYEGTHTSLEAEV